jgi:hypothetical protein
MEVGVTPGADEVLPAVPVQYSASSWGLKLNVAGVMLATVTAWVPPPPPLLPVPPLPLFPLFPLFPPLLPV